MESTLDPRKQCLVLNVVNFLQEELIKGNLNDERKESVEVAIQCLETAFELDNDTRTKFEQEKLDLLNYIQITPKVQVTEEQKALAEQCKTQGNTHMKNSCYNEAVVEYSKAIQIDPTNAVYYCNRAAAYSRLEKHYDAISDCKEAIRLDPTYGKAYGRLGIAYSNLNKFEEARTSYLVALKCDPENSMYETNLKLAEEKLFANMESAAPPEHRPLDISQFINNPSLIDMATQMLGDPSFRNIMSAIMSMGESGDPQFNALFQAGQTLASRMQSADPNFVESLRRSLNPQNNPSAPPAETDNESKPGKSRESDGKPE